MISCHRVGCSNKSPSLKCQYCHLYYCGQTCMDLDSPNHKDFCDEMKGFKEAIKTGERIPAHICNRKDCTNKGLLKCSRCLNAHYCGKECQKLHFPEHKTACKDRALKLEEVNSKPLTPGGQFLTSLTTVKAETLVVSADPRTYMYRFLLNGPNGDKFFGGEYIRVNKDIFDWSCGSSFYLILIGKDNVLLMNLAGPVDKKDVPTDMNSSELLKTTLLKHNLNVINCYIASSPLIENYSSHTKVEKPEETSIYDFLYETVREFEWSSKLIQIKKLQMNHILSLSVHKGLEIFINPSVPNFKM